MKFVCLGYMEEKKWNAMSESERNAFMSECLAYDDLLRKAGHIVGGEALQSVRTATTPRYQNGKVSVTDGLFAETKEQLGRILVIDAKDLNHAIQLMPKRPVFASTDASRCAPPQSSHRSIAESGRPVLPT